MKRGEVLRIVVAVGIEVETLVVGAETCAGADQTGFEFAKVGEIHRSAGVTVAAGGAASTRIAGVSQDVGVAWEIGNDVPDAPPHGIEKIRAQHPPVSR